MNAASVIVKVYYVTERPNKTVTIFQRVYPQVPSKGKIRFCFFWIVPELERKPSEKTKRYIRVALDPGNSMPECNEANNAAEQEIAIVSKTGPYDGVLTADNSIYAPNDDCPVHGVPLSMTVTVEDQDLIDQSRVQVTIQTDVGDRETFFLPRVGPGIFRRTSFPACTQNKVTPPPATPGDGYLEFSGTLHGIIITVQHTDQQDSHGKTVVRSQTVRYTP